MDNLNEDFKKQLEEQLKQMEIEEKRLQSKKKVESRPIENLIGLANIKVNDSEMAEDLKFATDKGIQEMEEFRQIFLHFQEQAAGLVVYKEVQPLVEEIAETLSGLLRLLADDIDENQLSQSAKESYWLAQKSRARLLAELYNFYK